MPKAKDSIYNRKPIFGIGILDADYKIDLREYFGYKDGKQIYKTVWTCSYFMRWYLMLQRCYSKSYVKSNITYVDCSVTPEWHYFMTFRAWMQKQDWEGKHLDKDLLVEGNKIYGPDRCIFISNQLNAFINEKRVSKNNLLPGVSFHKPSNKFCAQIYNPLTKKAEWLGLYSSESEAHEVYWNRKCYFASRLLKEESNPVIMNSLINKYGVLNEKVY